MKFPPGVLASRPQVSGGKSLQEILVTDLALSSGLQLILDAGDINSYAGSGNWLDVSGGTSNNFAPVTGASGADPAFQGSAGGLSEAEYFTVDGTAFAAFQETAAQTFLEQMHQNNGVGTLLAAVYLPDPSGIASDMSLSFIYDAESVSQRGIVWGITYVAGFGWVMGFNCYKGSSPAAYTAQSAAFASMQIGWNIVAFAFNEASNVITAFVNGAAQTGTCTYASPSATASGSLANALFKRTGTNSLAGIGIGGLAVWSNYKAEAALDSIYAAIKADRLPSLA